MYQKIKENGKYFCIACLAVANVFVWYAAYREQGRGFLAVAFLDVGQGDSIFIESPTGNQILIDGGPGGGSVLRELAKVMPFYDRSLDFTISTHPHADHLTGVLDVLNRYYVSGILHTVDLVASPMFQNMKVADLINMEAKEGQVINIGGGAYIKILSADETSDPLIVARLVYGKTSFLLMSDATGQLEDQLLSRLGRAALDSDVLKVSHHGSRFSSGSNFLRAVSPELSVVQVGKNSYGHPNREAMSRILDVGSKIMRTDENGTVVLFDDGQTISAQ
ncbi:MAG: MBL fold metallo-hydrolase [Candidatus Paceibacterota bacterium]|jgi:competence protein ComEC